jgi:hypothetical protein
MYTVRRTRVVTRRDPAINALVRQLFHVAPFMPFLHSASVSGLETDIKVCAPSFLSHTNVGRRNNMRGHRGFGPLRDSHRGV